ncbi:MAG: OmpA family protein [Bacteroidia bacterium]|nr:OmpA family protein [Bacteroidia bacterium]MDW8347645.1 OmpA family protein [Bacteroidia bacterium]
MRCFLFLILSVCATLHAQKVWFEDNFNDYSKGWTYGKTSETQKEVKNGVYRITIKDPNASAWTFWNYSIFLDPEKDFSIECVITQINGVDNHSYGITWGKDVDNAYCFGISSNGYYIFYAYIDGKYTEIQPWQKISCINKMGTPNILKVTQKGRKWDLFVNNNRVYTTSVRTPYGTSVGFLTNKQMTIEVDNIIIRQDNFINLVPNAQKSVKKNNLGSEVNTRYEDVSPVISPDGKTLFYGIKRSPENVGGAGDAEDAWFSTTNDEKYWTKRQNLGKPLNNSSANVVISVMPDNNTMIMMHRYKNDGTYNGQGLSITFRTENGWTIPEDIFIEDFYNNAKYNEFFVSADRKVLLMTVQRDDSYGNKDIYVSFATGERRYSRPMNIGKTVNTIGDEVSPFLASDGVTLYYATDGKPGYGSHDIFVTRRLDDTWKNWSEPQNLGPNINTIRWDAYYTVTASGKYAYMVSSEGGIEGSSDIIQVEMPQEAKPKPVLIVYGKVLNAKTNEPIATNVSYRDLATDEELGIARSNPKDGSYKIILPQGKQYGFFATKQGFLATSENLDTQNLKEFKEVEVNLYLTPIEVGQCVRLNNIFFEPNSATLKMESYGELKRVADFLKTNTNIVIEIGGHTDNGASGTSPNYLIQLSQARAKAVADYILKCGVNVTQINYKGYGSTKPIADNNSPEGRAKNRRVEFTVLKK